MMIILLLLIIIIILKYFYRITASVLRKKLLSMKLLMIVLQFESKNCFVLARIIKKKKKYKKNTKQNKTRKQQKKQMKKSRKVVKIMYTIEALIIVTVSCVQKLQNLSKCLPPRNMWSLSALTRKYANTILFPLNVAWCSCDLFLQCFGVFSKYRLIYIATWCYIIFDATVSIHHNVTYDWFVGQLWQWLHWLTWKSFCF